MSGVNFVANQYMLYRAVRELVVKRADCRARVSENILNALGFETFNQSLGDGYFNSQNVHLKISF
jgi:hypothetical protein